MNLLIKSHRYSSEKYREEWERIFKKKCGKDCECKKKDKE
jgi:hypothetical protein